MDLGSKYRMAYKRKKNHKKQGYTCVKSDSERLGSKIKAQKLSNCNVTKVCSSVEQVSQIAQSERAECSSVTDSELSNKIPKKRLRKEKFNQVQRIVKPSQVQSTVGFHVPINFIFRNKRARSFLQEALADECKVEISNTSKDKLGVIDTSPFLWGEIPNFIQSANFVNGLKRELSNLKFYKRNCDLFQFYQSPDLQNQHGHHIKMFRRILLERCIPWFREVMDFPLANIVDMTCSAYRFSDFLLCHDDQMAGRRVAFVYYLVPDWEKSDGGTLDLFNSESEQPTSIATSLTPEWNKLVFFEVGPSSFHQVSEVLSKKLRLSISGWFHVNPPVPKKPSFAIEPLLLHVPKYFKGDIKKWIHPSYFIPAIQKKIRNSFATKSEIELTSFLKLDKCMLVDKALRDTEETDWNLVGPANKRHFKELVVIPPIVEECLTVLGSDEMCSILSKLTGLSFNEEEETSEEDESSGSTSTVEGSPHLSKKHCLVVRHWTHGDYTLLHDNSHSCFALDVTLYFAPSGWSGAFGGFSSYIAKDDGCEMLRVKPKMNSLALVYRDRTTDKFIKYINAKSFVTEPASFFDIDFTFSE